MDINSQQKNIILSSCSGCAYRVPGERLSSQRGKKSVEILQYAFSSCKKKGRDEEIVASVVSCVCLFAFASIIFDYDCGSFLLADCPADFYTSECVDASSPVKTGEGV